MNFDFFRSLSLARLLRELRELLQGLRAVKGMYQIKT
jgi:hypothetical protein